VQRFIVAALVGLGGILTGCVGPWTFQGPPSPELYVATRTDVVAISSSGEVRTLVMGCTSYSLNLWEGELFLKCNMTSLQVHDLEGNLVRTIPIPDQISSFISFTVVDQNKFALFDNRGDSIYFIDASGNLLATVALPPSPQNWQSIEGVMVEGKLVVLDSAANRLFQIDPQTYEVFTLFNLSVIPQMMLAVDYANGKYYLAGDDSVYRFDIREGPTLIAQLDGRATGIAVSGERAYVGVMRTGEIYSVDLASGETNLVVTGLDGVYDLEVRP